MELPRVIHHALPSERAPLKMTAQEIGYAILGMSLDRSPEEAITVAEVRSGSFFLLADGRGVSGADRSEAEYRAESNFGTRVARDGSAFNPEGERA